MSSALGTSQQTVLSTTTQPYLNFNLIQWFVWTHPLVTICVSPGARLVVKVQEWLRGQTASTTNDTMLNWRESDTQGPTDSMFLYVSLGMVAFWLIWLLTCPASVIGVGTFGVSVPVLTGRSEGLLSLWRSVLSEVSYTLMPLTQERRSRKPNAKRREWGGGGGG